ncbi:hypothetical protein N0V84_010054 [Fusarium piperis]|uniref:Aminoglycoside phosphotransferase domain-containing protein n=1 Tax=Fusarium piperis TaxID=1435070 RepID=A0A9W8W557_9HYPO|nr:hypothetical protein N0V84_010054 [Fusarium piperis]
MSSQNPTKSVAESPSGRVQKPPPRSQAARWNRTMLKLLESDLKKDPEIDISKIFGKTYSDKLRFLKEKSPIQPPLRRRGVRLEFNTKDEVTVIADLSPDLENLLQPGTSLSESLVDLLDNGECLHESLAGYIVVFKLSPDIVAKVATEDSVTTEHRSLVYLQQHLPTFPAPRSHGVVRFGNYHIIFSTFIPGSDLESVWPQLNGDQKQNISDQLETYFRQLRSIPCPAGIPLGGVGGEGCKDIRRQLRMNTDPITSEHEFQKFVFSGSRAASSLYTNLLRNMMPEHPVKVVFTHGDVRAANIMVERIDSSGWKVTSIIDWEASGFYPEYWESIKATNNLTPREKSDWYQYLPTIISPKSFAIHWLADRVWDPSAANS